MTAPEQRLIPRLKSYLRAVEAAESREDKARCFHDFMGLFLGVDTQQDAQGRLHTHLCFMTAVYNKLIAFQWIHHMWPPGVFRGWVREVCTIIACVHGWTEEEFAAGADTCRAVREAVNM